MLEGGFLVTGTERMVRIPLLLACANAEERSS